MCGGEQPQFDKPYSDDMARRIDIEVKRIIDDVRVQTRQLLDERADKLEELAQALLEKEVLNENDLKEVLGEDGPARELFEKVVWEVVPQLAEAILREEIAKVVRERLSQAS